MIYDWESTLLEATATIQTEIVIHVDSNLLRYLPDCLLNFCDQLEVQICTFHSLFHVSIQFINYHCKYLVLDEIGLHLNQVNWPHLGGIRLSK